MKVVLSNPSLTSLEKSAAKSDLRAARIAHQHEHCRHQASLEHDHDQKLSAILSENPSVAIKHLKSVRSNSNSKISEIIVDGQVFTDDHVATVLYHNVKNLKTELDPSVGTCTSCDPFKSDYKLIREILQSRGKDSSS